MNTAPQMEIRAIAFVERLKICDIPSVPSLRPRAARIYQIAMCLESRVFRERGGGAGRAALAAFALVFALRAASLAELLATPLASWHLWSETDEHAYVEWSALLAAGNWRDVPAYRAYFNWQKEYGDEAAWEGWYQKDAYYSGPLYPYALAVVRRVSGRPSLPMRLLQLLLACCASAAIAAAVGRLGEEFLRREEGKSRRVVAWSAVSAGVLYGAYGPLVFHDFFLYRDGPV